MNEEKGQSKAMGGCVMVVVTLGVEVEPAHSVLFLLTGFGGPTIFSGNMQTWLETLILLTCLFLDYERKMMCMSSKNSRGICSV